MKTPDKLDTPAEDEATVLPMVDVNTEVRLQRRSRRIAMVGAIVGITLLSGALTGWKHLLPGASRSEAHDEPVQVTERPAAATGEPRTLEMPVPATAAESRPPRVPAIVATADEPIALRQAAGSPRTAPAGLPEDAPAMLVTSRAPASAPLSLVTPQASVNSHEAGVEDPLRATTINLRDYQRQLQGVVDRLTRTADDAVPMPAASTTGDVGAGPASTQDLFGGQLQASATRPSLAHPPGNRSLTLSKGAAFTCVLKTRIISAASGLVGCQVQRDVYGDDGRVLLIERGSHVDGEYRIATLRPGMVRIPVLWTRLRTPLGVTVELGSPATGQLGESGIDGHVDRRWSERIGAAMLLSLIDDSVKLVIQSQRESDGGTVVLPSTTSNTSKLAEKVLDGTINIPPLVYRDQGGIVGIYVARDIDFSSVYDLIPVDADSRRP